jgi:ABC-2 type transport system permease protein
MKPAVQPDSHDAYVSDAPRRKTGGFGLTALWSLYLLTFRQHLHGKRWMVMTGLFLLPVALAVITRATSSKIPSEAVEFLLVFMFIPQALLPLVALVYASGIIQDEQEDQTLTYLLIRPLPKWSIYPVKMLATITTTSLLTMIFTAMTYLTIYAGSDAGTAHIAKRCLIAIGIHCLAVTTYCCLFGLMSLLTRWALIVGILYAAIFEGLLANMPFGVRLMTIIYYTRLIAYRSLEFKTTEPNGRVEDMAAIVWQLDTQTDPKLLEHPQLSTCIIVLGAASLVLTMIAALICSQREFHVKTPQGN